jgi:hypothetical protein
MPLDRADRDFLRKLYDNLRPERPLEPGSPFYEPIYQEPKLGLEDPVQQIATLIDYNGGESIRLFSGFRGSGKTTELKRLRKQLEGEGYFVLYADALDYVSAAEPIEIGELLIALAGAFGESLQIQLGRDILKDNFWNIAQRFLNTEITVKEVGLKAEIAKSGLDLRAQIADRIQPADPENAGQPAERTHGGSQCLF